MKTTEMVVNNNRYIIINALDKKEKQINKIKEEIKKIKSQMLNNDIKSVIVIQNSENAIVMAEAINKDGTIGSLSGNAMLCVAKYLKDNRFICSDSISIEMKSRIRTIEFDEENMQFDINFGKGSISTKKIPVLSEKSIFINMPICAIDNIFKFTAVSIGNPHIVTYVDNLDEIDIKKYGPYLESNYLFPEHVNVEFAQKIDDNTVKIKIWERGCGETESCATASCATIFAGIMSRNLTLDNEFTVKTVSSEQKVIIDENNNYHLLNSSNLIHKNKMLKKI